MKERYAILGQNGFIGSHLHKRLGVLATGYTRNNSHELALSDADTLIVAAAPAAKWFANENSDNDLVNIHKILETIKLFPGDRCILISTIDVFPQGTIFDEDSQLPDWNSEAYGRNRAFLEKETRRLFPEALIVRLPGMFGPGLKKNLIFDLLNNNGNPTAHPESTFQFYDVRDLVGHIMTASELRIPTINLATQPFSVRQLFSDIFNQVFITKSSDLQVNYKMKTKHSYKLAGRQSDFLKSDLEIVAALKTWIMESKT
jgi:nucleoside-diphosphate-sugar epimerase